jgi:GMP synthase (glutamine-hydrolysing)
VGTFPVVLVVEHQATCPAAWFGDWLQEARVALQVIRPYRGDPLPRSLGGVAGLLVLGGAMGADEVDEHPWLSPTKDLIVRAADRALPTLGICLGHQLVASALGGSVVASPRGREIGVRPVDWLPAAAGDPLFAPVVNAPCVAVYWNNDVIGRVPRNGSVLARGDTGEIQALRVGEWTWGVQFHPEVSPALARTWVVEEQRATGSRRGLDDVVDAVRVQKPTLQLTWSGLARSFASRVGAE